METVFKKWNNGNQSLNNIMRGSLMLFTPHSMTTLFNHGGKAISLTCHTTFSTQSPQMPKLKNVFLKIFSPTLL